MSSITSGKKPTLAVSALRVAAKTMAVLATATSITSSPVYANECGAPYPSILQQQEYNDYFYIDITPVSDETIDQVKNFNERLDGRWHGSVTDIKCDVSPYADYDPLTIINSFDVDAEFEKHFRGALILQLQQENAEQVHLDTLFLTPNTEEFDLDTQGRKNQGQKVGQRNYSVDFPSEDTLVFNEKYRRFSLRDPRPVLRVRDIRNDATHAVRLVQEIKTVSIGSESELTIQRDVYVNGRFSAQQEWQLKRL